MINYNFTGQIIDKKIFKKRVIYNLLANGYNRDNTIIYFGYNYNVMNCSIYFNQAYFYLEFVTLPNNCSTIYMLNTSKMGIPMHLLKSFFGALKFTNILSAEGINEYSKQIYDNLYITDLKDTYNYMQAGYFKYTPRIKEVTDNYPLNSFISYFNKISNSGLTSIVKYNNFPYYILYNVYDNKNTISKLSEVQKSINEKILYIYYSNSNFFNIKEETIYSFTAVRTFNDLDIRILGE